MRATTNASRAGAAATLGPKPSKTDVNRCRASVGHTNIITLEGEPRECAS